MKMNKVFNSMRFGLSLGLLIAFCACTEKWDDHYSETDKIVSEQTLWDVIKADADLTQFSDLLKATGYDSILSQSRVYTVWAPVNGSFNKDSLLAEISAGNKDLVITEFVQNHIADYSYSASGTVDKKVMMLNEKVIEFAGVTSNYTFQDIPLKELNNPANNGLVHTLAFNTKYWTNIWEYLSRLPELDSIKTFLYSYDEIEFDEDASVQGPIVDGEVTYLDSVITNSNRWFRVLGRLNDEDSTYLMFAPTNEVWATTLEKTKTYYQYAPSKTASVQLTRDSLSNYYSKLAIVRNLVFSNTVQVNEGRDSLTSTTRNVFRYGEKDALFDDCRVPVTLSNGQLYVADKFNYRSITWHDTIKVEAENTSGRETPDATILNNYRVTSTNRNDTISGEISRSQYIDCSTATSTGSPSVTFTLPNTLSASYRIKCVFVPVNMTSKNMLPEAIMPNKVRFQLKNTLANGSVGTSINISGVVTNPAKIDTVLVYSIDPTTKDTLDYYTFPFCEYGFTTAETTTTLTVMTNVTRTEKEYDRSFRIDCIILEPVEK